MKSREEFEAEMYKTAEEEFTLNILQNRDSLEEIYHLVDVIRYKVNAALGDAVTEDTGELHTPGYSKMVANNVRAINHNLTQVKIEVQELVRCICPKDLEDKYKKERPKF
jgi:hypothetical protein